MPIYGTFRKRLAPTAPSGLASDLQTTTSISLTWTNNHAEGTADEIIILEDGMVIDEIGGDAQGYTRAGLNPGETHTYQVAAANGEGSSASAEISVSTVSGAAPTITAQPMDKSVEDGAGVTFQVIAQNALTYQWERSTDGGSSWADISGATAPYYTLTATTAANGYQYRCTVSNDFGETNSSAATLTVTAASGLTAVDDLAVALASDSQADLTWTDQSAGETAYKVHRDGSLIHTTAANAASYSDTGATPGATHVYRVDVTDGTNTLAGNEVTVTMAGPQIASSPTDEWIPDGGTAVFGVAMAPDQGTVTYQWERSTDSGGSWADVSGATSAYYEAAFTTADSGNLYRCKCTTGAGTVTSESAELTVYAHEHHHDTTAVLEGWGFRKIRAAYAGDCCQIRSSGGSTHDIGWSGGKVDQAALETAAGGARATLVKLYGQGPLGVDVDFTGAEPYITDSAGNLLEEDGVPYYEGASDGSYGTADFTGNEIDADDVSFALLLAMNLANTGSGSGQPDRVLLTFTDQGLEVPGQLRNIAWNAGGNVNKIGQYYGGRLGWLSGYSNGSQQDFFLGTMVCGFDRQITDERYTAAGSGHAEVRVSNQQGVRISEIILWPAAVSRSTLLDRVIRADRNYCLGPRDTAYDGVYPSFKDQYKLCQWLARLDETDFTLPTVASKTANSVTVTGPDWSWVPIGQKLKIGTTTEGVDLTVSAAPTFANGQTTFPVAEDTTAATVGMEVMVDPYWDGQTADVEYAAGLEIKYRNASNTNRDLNGSANVPKASGHEPGWYTLETTTGTHADLTPDASAIIDAGAPSTTGLTGGISDDGTGLRALLLRYDLTSLAARPKVAVLNVVYSGTNDAADRQAVPYVGAKVYEDLSWSAATVTWNSSPVVLSPKPVTYDTYASLRPKGLERTLDLTAAIQSAYDAGASTVTVALYLVNDLENQTATTRETTFSSTVLRCTTKQGQNVRGLEVPYQIGYQSDNTHHYGWGNAALATYHDSLPLADGRNGSPFYHHVPLLRRGVAVNVMGTIRRYADWSATPDPRQIAGLLWTSGPMLYYAGAILDEGTRRALEREVLRQADDFRITCTLAPGSSNWNNANQDCKGVEGGAYAYLGLRSAGDKTTLANNIRAAMLGRTDGDILASPPVWNRETAFFRANGMICEGTVHFALNPESDYLGRSWSHLFVAAGLTHDQADWAWLRDCVRLLTDFVEANIFEEKPGVYHSPSGYCGRASGAPTTRAQFHWYGNVMTAAVAAEFRPFLRKLTTGVPEFQQELSGAIAAAVAAINATTYGRGQNFKDKTSSGGGRRDWPYLNYAIGFSWPPEMAHEPLVSGWHSTLKALVDASSTDSYWLGTPDNWATGTATFPRTPGEEDFISIRAGTGDERWKALIQGGKETGEYGGTKDGSLHFLWKSGYGGVICSHKPLNTKKYGFPNPSSAYPAPMLQDAETIICQYDTLVYGTEDGGPRLNSGGFAMNGGNVADASLRTAAWNGTDTLTTTAILPQNKSYGFLASGDEIKETKVYRVLTTAGDSMEGIECSVTLDYTSGAPKDVLQLYHQLPCLVGTKESPSHTLAFDYWTGTAWVRVSQGLLDEWIDGIQYIRLVKDWADGNGERYAWIILDSARAVMFPSVTTEPTGGRIKRLAISVHPGTEGVATELPAQTTYSWKVTTTDPGLVSSTAVATLTAPAAAGDRPFEGEPWMLAGTVSWGPKTADTVTYEYSTDYAGDEGTATWNNIGTGTASGDAYEYYGGTVPSGVTAVRIKATASDASTATDVLAVLSKAPAVVLADTFTDTDGTMLSAHTPAANTTGNSYTFSYYEPDIQSNRADNTASTSKPDNGTFAAIEVGTDNYVIKALVNTETANSETKGPWLGMGVNRNTCYIKAHVSSTGVHVQTRSANGFTPVITSYTSYLPSTNTDYQLEVQRIGSSFGFRLLSADGLTEHMRGAVHNITAPTLDDGPCFGIGSRGTIDEVEISI